MSHNPVFDRYAHEYDWMTNASVREAQHDREVTALIEKYHPTNVLDAGCATGLTSTLFARHNVKATGLDQSRAMIAIARGKSRDSDLPPEYVLGSFEKLPRRMRGGFDLVVSLANSLSGAATISDLKRYLCSFHAVLRPGGTIVIQLLNAAALKPGQGVPLKATGNRGIIYLRHLERSARGLTLDVIRVDSHADPITFDLFRSAFPGFTKSMLTDALASSGFRRIRSFNNLFLAEPFHQKSRDLVVVGTKPAR